MRLILLLLPALVACSAQDSRPSPGVRRERQAAAEAAVSKTPVPRTYRYGDGELKVIEVQTADRYGLLDTSRCFLWRDAETKATSISCTSTADVMATPPRD